MSEEPDNGERAEGAYEHWPPSMRLVAPKDATALGARWHPNGISSAPQKANTQIVCTPRRVCAICTAVAPERVFTFRTNNPIEGV